MNLKVTERVAISNCRFIFCYDPVQNYLRFFITIQKCTKLSEVLQKRKRRCCRHHSLLIFY